MLKANGKFIDTLPLKNLFSLNEHCADMITIEVDSSYKNLNLSNFTFVMRAVTPSGAEIETTLLKIAPDDDSILWLVWEVSREFTNEAGTLFLDLYAYKYDDPTADPTETPPDYLLRYQLPPIEIREIPQTSATDP